MKKTEFSFKNYCSYACFTICYIAFLSLLSCSGNDEESYKEACQKGDFETAHKILDELEQDCIEKERKFDAAYSKFFGREEERSEMETSSDKYARATRYIYSAEAQYIMTNLEQQDAVLKIDFLLIELKARYNKYYNINDTLCDIFRIALNKKNKEVARCVIGYFDDYDRRKYEKEYESAVAKGLFDE